VKCCAAGFYPAERADGPAVSLSPKHCRPDLFLLDISMSGMDGWTVARRCVGPASSGRILMVSASALEAHGTPLAQPFHDGYLMKPIDIRGCWKFFMPPAPQERVAICNRTNAVPHWTGRGSGSRPPVKHVEELIGLGPNELHPRHPGQAR